MRRQWTFGQQVTGGFAAVVGLTVIAGVITVLALHKVSTDKDRVINTNAALLVNARKMDAASSEKTAAARGYILTGTPTFLNDMDSARSDFTADLQTVKQQATTPEGQRFVEEIQNDEAAHQQAIDSIIVLKKTGAPLDAVANAFETQAAPKRAQVKSDTDAFVSYEQGQLNAARHASNRSASASIWSVVGVVCVTVAVAIALALFLTRRLRRQIGTTVSEVQSSSAELQATANQQATGAKEQATSMGEINTTITELLATSRQIADSAQRVADIAEQTAGAGRAGEDTIHAAQASMVDIKQQVDLIVGHMLELGEKSQQIGAVLDIVSELAEQTNILAINSTIEAAGAGESGKRFAVVADEIRKLADRVADSTKEIRVLIDVVRGAVNTTVMATEIGSKAVDAGAQQFVDVASSFEEIASLVTTTTEAAKEIELSTKQQSTAVEQVNIAITSVAQATRETEASSTQTFQTATQLTDLSKELQLLIEAQSSRSASH